MFTVRRRFAATALVVAALLTAPALAGCSVVEGAIESATGGEVDLGGKSVPKDFPAEVPLAQGEVVFGLGAGAKDEKIWNVTIKVPEGAFDSISAQLTGAGFTQAEGTDQVAEGMGGLFTSDNYGVLVVVSEDGNGGFVANYTVSTVTGKG